MAYRPFRRRHAKEPAHLRDLRQNTARSSPSLDNLAAQSGRRGSDQSQECIVAPPENGVGVVNWPPFAAALDAESPFLHVAERRFDGVRAGSTRHVPDVLTRSIRAGENVARRPRISCETITFAREGGAVAAFSLLRKCRRRLRLQNKPGR